MKTYTKIFITDKIIKWMQITQILMTSRVNKCGKFTIAVLYSNKNDWQYIWISQTYWAKVTRHKIYSLWFSYSAKPDIWTNIRCLDIEILIVLWEWEDWVGAHRILLYTGHTLFLDLDVGYTRMHENLLRIYLYFTCTFVHKCIWYYNKRLF